MFSYKIGKRCKPESFSQLSTFEMLPCMDCLYFLTFWKFATWVIPNWVSKQSMGHVNLCVSTYLGTKKYQDFGGIVCHIVMIIQELASQSNP